jgi:hypothetical protein
MRVRNQRRRKALRYGGAHLPLANQAVDYLDQDFYGIDIACRLSSNRIACSVKGDIS